MKKGLLFIFIIAFLIRLINLNQSLWLDEATTAMVVKSNNFWEIVTKFSPFDFHPPLYYWLIKLWSGFFGYSEISLRFPSIIFSLLTGYVVYRIAKLLNSHMTEIWAAVFFLFNPLIVYYSQEARMYMMVTFLLTTSLYYLISIIQNSKFKDQNYSSKFKINFLLMNLFFILSILTFYGSIFFIITVLIYLLVKKQYKLFFISSIYCLASIILISPLLYQQLINARISLAAVANWSLVLGKANIKNLLLIPVKFSIGRIDFYPKWFYYSIAGLWTGFVLYQILNIKNQKHISKIKYELIYFLVTPIILGFMISFFTPLLQYFRFIYLVTIMSLLLGFQLHSQSERWLVLTGFIVFSLVYLLIPTFHREDWKSLARSLPPKSIVYMIKASADPLKYYRNDLKINELTLLHLLGQASLPKKLIIIPYTAEIYGFDYKKILNNFNYSLNQKKSYRELVSEVWTQD